jgi:phosphate starvation-inducible membrane PsiE
MNKSRYQSNENLSPLGLLALAHFIILPILAVPFTLNMIVRNGYRNEYDSAILTDTTLSFFPYFWYTMICMLLFKSRIHLGIKDKKFAFLISVILWLMCCVLSYQIF